MHIVAVDWAKSVAKRAVYRADTAARTISRVPLEASLGALLEYAASLAGPVLIAIDAAIGFPQAAWRRLVAAGITREDNFPGFLLGPSLPKGFFEPVSRSEDWSPRHPFVRLPAGRGSRRAFETAAGGGFYRRIDLALGAQPIFVASGIPGTVGSGTRALWQEMIAFGREPAIRIWPFHGPLEDLLRGDQPVLAEIYPKACYGIALADRLPAIMRRLSKTAAGTRTAAISELREAAWVGRERIVLADLDAAADCEDNFDALLSAAALLRLFLEDSLGDMPAAAEARVEGGVLGAASLQPGPAGRSRQPTGRTRTGAVAGVHRCPIPGCGYVFRKGRSGWDAHVASLRRHPAWHSEIEGSDSRKAIFKQEYADWFR